jgi:hypothetical protein
MRVLDRRLNFFLRVQLVFYKFLTDSDRHCFSYTFVHLFYSKIYCKYTQR